MPPHASEHQSRPGVTMLKSVKWGTVQSWRRETQSTGQRKRTSKAGFTNLFTSYGSIHEHTCCLDASFTVPNTFFQSSKYLLNTCCVPDILTKARHQSCLSRARSPVWEKESLPPVHTNSSVITAHEEHHQERPRDSQKSGVMANLDCQPD